MKDRYRIHTYADGHGLWHALVRDRTHDTNERLTDKQVRNIRDAGKRAIIRELKERDDGTHTTVKIIWEDCRQMDRKIYIGSPDTLHIVETAL